jgi:hypothetical protein
MVICINYVQGFHLILWMVVMPKGNKLQNMFYCVLSVFIPNVKLLGPQTYIITIDLT